MSFYELLAPAGDFECLMTALRFGADAVYLGGPMLQLRARSAAFSEENLRKAIEAVHARGKKLYVTVNAFARNDEIEALADYAQMLHALGADAVIVSDLGAIATVRRAAPLLPVHVSTQANCMNYAAAAVYADMGVKRIVLAREMHLNEIAELRAKLQPDVELEAFVHGAMCMSYSGRCMISAHLTGRSGNRGACAQSCRWNYALMEEKRPGQYFPVEEDEKGMAILSSSDLNCLSFLDEIMAAGVTSFKIEGRMKTPYYVATVVNAYRRRLDGLLRGESTPEQAALLQRELDSASHRTYSSGFYFGDVEHKAGDTGGYLSDCLFVGVVREVLEGGWIRFEARNKIVRGQRVELLSPRALGLSFIVDELRNAEGEREESASRPSELYEAYCGLEVEPGDLMRLRVSGT